MKKRKGSRGPQFYALLLLLSSCDAPPPFSSIACASSSTSLDGSGSLAALGLAALFFDARCRLFACPESWLDGLCHSTLCECLRIEPGSSIMRALPRVTSPARRTASSREAPAMRLCALEYADLQHSARGCIRSLSSFRSLTMRASSSLTSLRCF